MIAPKQLYLTCSLTVLCFFILTPQYHCKTRRGLLHKRNHKRRHVDPLLNEEIKVVMEKTTRKGNGSKQGQRETRNTTLDPLIAISRSSIPILSTRSHETFSETTKIDTVNASFTTSPATIKTSFSDTPRPKETTFVETSSAVLPKHKILSTKLGKIKGKVEHLPSGKVYAYLGIPYGESPDKDNRFKATKPVKAWNTVKDALEYASTCHQWQDFSFDEVYQKGFRGTRMWNPNTKMSEDCLYLNVWTPTSPKKSKTNKLAVLVWIYGGGFYSGTSSLDVYTGKWLASTQKVVVVSMNYRIGALGFLATGHPEIPGNAGLFDQRLALRWVKDNIRSFGGDPNTVTVFGESAGAASVALHLMSEGSKGLFKNAILQSASSLSPWAVLSKEESLRRALNLAKEFNCFNFTDAGQFDENEVKFTDEMVSCLREVDPQMLVKKEMLLEDWGTAGFPNAAFVDNNFLTSSPHEMDNDTYFNENVNIMAGFNANEGTYFLVYGSPGFTLNTESKISPKNFTDGIHRALRSLKGVKDTTYNIKNILGNISSFMYTGRNSEDDSSRFNARYSLHNDKKTQDRSSLKMATFYRDRLDDMAGDINFVCPTIDFLDNFLKRRNAGGPSEGRRKSAYMYKFVHRSSQNPWPEWMGVMHGYEIEFIFGLPLDDQLNYTEVERNISKNMMKMWANFAKHNNPNGKSSNDKSTWPAYNEDTKYIYVIGDAEEDTLNSRSSLYSNKYSSQLTHCAFWKEQFPSMKERMHQIRSPCTCPVTSPNGGISRSGVGLGRSSLMILVVMCLLPLF